MYKRASKKKTWSAGLLICIIVFALLCVSIFAAKLVMFQNHVEANQSKEKLAASQLKHIILEKRQVIHHNDNFVSIRPKYVQESTLEPSPKTKQVMGLLETKEDTVTEDITPLKISMDSSVHSRSEDLILSTKIMPIKRSLPSVTPTGNKVEEVMINWIEDDGRGSYGRQWKPITSIKPNDWFIYLRIQKTGSQTFWQTLQNFFDGSIWGRHSTCQKGLFCGDRCLKIVEEQISTILTSRGRRKRVKDPNQCSLIFRGHINMHDYLVGVNQVINSSNIRFVSLPATPRVQNRIFFMTFLREPIARVVSEYRHITEGIVAQFGPHTFGAAWDYNFTFYPKMAMDRKRKLGTFAAWIDCDQCRVGARNRMTRFLGSTATTGQLLPQESEHAKKGELDKAQGDMLRRAKMSIESCLFLGIMERYEDSMLVLKHTFPEALAKMNSYSTSPHAQSKYVTKISDVEISLITSLNQLDVNLYDHAKDLFEQRLRSMKQSLPPEKAKLSFKKMKGQGNREIFRLQ